ncbi:glycosyltransferase, partial [Candidatus Margulisiibacteriota bacterium]
MLSIVIPAYNEQERLPQTIRRIQEYFKQKDYTAELIVVDDGSMDNMLQTIPPGIKVIQNGINRGKGYSVRQGVLAAGGDYILFSDADLSTPIEE